MASTLAQAGAAAQEGAAAPGFDGDPATTERIAAADPVSAAIAVSQARFAGGASAAHVVLATVADFADSLAGAALTTSGPLLLTDPASLTAASRDELQRVLAAGGRVYLLGGTSAISQAVQDEVAGLGYDVRRLEGQTRVQTALAVADELRALHPSATVLIARSEGTAGNPTSAWADSMTGGALAAAAEIPIIVTPTASLHPDVAAWLTAAAPTRTILLGGEAALSEAVEDAIPGAERLAGPERTATTARIAESDLWAGLTENAPRRFVILNGALADGWAYGLSAAGLASDAAAPPLMVGSTVTAETRRLVSSCGDADVDLLLVGDGSVIADTVQDTLSGFDGSACAASFAALSQFSSCQDTLQYFINEGLSRVGPYGLDGYWYGGVAYAEGGVVEDEATGEPGGAPAPAAPADGEATSDASGGGSGEEVSGTNVQEVGVDEPDYVKANASAAYVSNNLGIDVVNLTGTAPVYASTIDPPGDAYGHELLLDGDVLLVLGRGNGYIYPAEPAPDGTSFAPDYAYPEPTTLLSRYDVSNPLVPQLLDSTELDGDYRSARMVNGIVRLVSSANPTGLEFVYPQEDTQQARDEATAHNRQVIQESTLDNWLPRVGEGDGQQAVACDNVFAPPGFSGISTILVSTVDVGTSVLPTSAAALVATGETIYASPNRLVVTSSQWGSWADEFPPAVTTEVHSFDITNPAATTYVASGQVDGYILNSFSISERAGYYRIATTTQPPWTVEGPTGETDNGVTILTEGGAELFETGRVFGLGLGEQIFAVRYLGDLAAVVTFRQTDPLYLVDLSNPSAPRVAGSLHLPGVSNYLHPLDNGYLLGVGQDGTEDGQLTGSQVSLFDVSDPANPTRVDSLEFGQGYSPVEYDHKAFLFWGPLGRAFVPTDLYSETSSRSGVQAIDIDTVNGALNLAGEVNQPSQDGYYPSVYRTFVVGDTLYTVSYNGVSAHGAQSLDSRGYAPFPQQDGGCCVVIDPIPVDLGGGPA